MISDHIYQVLKYKFPLTGKHKFTPADLEELKSATKAVALTLMLCCILPSLEYIQKTLQSLVSGYYTTMRDVLGLVEYQWFEETVGTWCSRGKRACLV